MYRGPHRLTSSVLSVEGKIASPSQSKGKVHTSTEIISSIFTHQVNAPAMSASVNLEITVSVYTKRPEQPTTRTELPVELTTVLIATLTIENMEFAPELVDSSSKTFKELARDLELLLDDTFTEISGFLYVMVTSFEKGSIVCNFMIHMKAESLATAEEFQKVLTAATKDGKTGNYQISKIEVHAQDNVGAVQEKEPEGKSFPVKVIVIAAFVGVVALIIVFLFYKVSKQKM